MVNIRKRELRHGFHVVHHDSNSDVVIPVTGKDDLIKKSREEKVN